MEGGEVTRQGAGTVSIADILVIGNFQEILRAKCVILSESPTA
jgi:hypothetical protein